MDFVVPYDQLGATTPGPWTNASPQAGVQGSIVNANVFPAVQNEILNVQDEAGLTRDGTNLAQLLQAIRSGKLTFFVDSGTADALVVTPRTSFPSLGAGVKLSVLKGQSPNATTTPRLSVGGLTLPIVKENGSPLQPGDLPGSTLFTVVSDGTSFRTQGLRYSDGAPPASALWHVGNDTSSNAATIVATASPAVPTRIPDLAYLIFPANTCAGATTLNVGFGAIALTRSDASPLQANDYAPGQPLVIVDDGTQFRIATLVPSQISASTNSYVANYVTNNYAKGSLIARRVFATPGTFTYTPTAGTNKVSVTVQGGGAGGGGTQATGASSYALAGGGGSGGRADSDIASGFSGVTITVGSGGAGGNYSSSLGVGSNGTSSSFGALVSASGGLGGAGSPASTGAAVQAGGGPGYGSNGNVDNIPGIPGLIASGTSPTNFCSGGGGASTFGGGGTPIYPSSGAGNTGYGYGSGGSGAGAGASQPAYAGGQGANGVVIVMEYA